MVALRGLEMVVKQMWNEGNTWVDELWSVAGVRKSWEETMMNGVKWSSIWQKVSGNLM